MIVVTGANGRLGRLVVAALARRGAIAGITLASRDPSQLVDLAALGFATVQADFGDTESLRAAFAGARTLLMISMPGPIEARIPRHRQCIDAAREMGVERIVYTSRVNPVMDSLYPFAEIHAMTEAHLRASGVATTIVRNNEYIENIVPAITEAAHSGTLIMPGAVGKVAHISVVDIADILARLLLEDGHDNMIYELNGPEALSRDEIAARIAAAVQRPIITAPATPQAFGDIRHAQGRPPFMVEMAMGLFQAVDAGEFAQVWPDAARLLGRPPVSVRKWIADLT